MPRVFSGIGLNGYRILGYDNNQKSSFARSCGQGPKVALNMFRVRGSEF